MTGGRNISLLAAAARRSGPAVVLATILGVGGAASAQDNEALYPAAQCAAFWFGYSDYARLSPYLEFEQRDVAAANAFREVAVRLNGANTEVDTFIAAERQMMTRLVESYIYGGDTQSQDIFERLSAICREFAERHPETRDLK